MAEQRPKPPVIDLVAQPVRRTLVQFALAKYRESPIEEREWYNKSTLARETDISHESVRTQLSDGKYEGEERPGDIVRYGVFEPRDLSARTVLYRVPDSETMVLIDDCPVEFERLMDILTSGSNRRIATFFLDHQEGEWTKNQLINEETVGTNDGVRGNIDALVEIGLLSKDESGWDSYSLDAESDVTRFMYVLNDILLDSYW